MTIGELETSLGMTRANIRFREGIKPTGFAGGVQSLAKVVRSNVKGNPDGSSPHQEPQQAAVVL